MKNKLLYFGLVITLALGLMLAFCLISSATQITYSNFDISYPTNNDGFQGYEMSVCDYIGYGNIPNGNFYIWFSYGYDSNYSVYNTLILSDVEAFQNRYSGLDYDEFKRLNENKADETGLEIFYAFCNHMTEQTYAYLMSYEPVQSGADWNAIQNSVDTFFSDNDVPIVEPNTIVDENSLLGYLNDNAGVYITTQSETIAAQRETLSNQSVTIEELRSEIASFDEQKIAIFDKGYSEGMEEAGALKKGVLTLVSAPVYVIGNLLNFDVFGINLFSLFTSIITIIVIAFVIKKLSN